MIGCPRKFEGLRKKDSIVFFYCTTLYFEGKNADNCDAIIMSRKMERENLQDD